MGNDRHSVHGSLFGPAEKRHRMDGPNVTLYSDSLEDIFVYKFL